MKHYIIRKLLIILCIMHTRLVLYADSVCWSALYAQCPWPGWAAGGRGALLPGRVGARLLSGGLPRVGQADVRRCLVNTQGLGYTMAPCNASDLRQHWTASMLPSSRTPRIVNEGGVTTTQQCRVSHDFRKLRYYWVFWSTMPIRVV